MKFFNYPLRDRLLREEAEVKWIAKNENLANSKIRVNRGLALQHKI